jgi:beta-1,4-mannosyl-glycoprotein beta-1,4-N-acetylglucosaminyltransferase
MRVHELIFFCNEFDMLEAHLATHAPFVDKFFIVESRVTVSGLPKPLFLKENESLTSKLNGHYNYKLLEAPPELQPVTKGWSDFRVLDHKKNQWAHPIAAEGADWVQHSDCDEILYPHEHELGLRTLEANPDWMFACYKLRQSKTFVNCIQKKVNVYRYVKATPDGYLLSPKGHPRGATVTGPAGWHFHNCFSSFDEFWWKILNRNWFFDTMPTKEQCREVYERRGNGMHNMDVPQIEKFHQLMCDVPEAMEKRKQPITYLPKFMQDNIERFPFYG